MLKFEYIIDKGNFDSIDDFEDYINRMGNRGYELINYKQITGQCLKNIYNCEPRPGCIHIVITWKLESSK